MRAPSVQIDREALARLSAHSAATIHEAIGRRGALPARIRPIAEGMKVAGPALTVFCPSGDNLALHAAMERAEPGDVLVVDHENAEDGPFGDLMGEACLARGIAGLVIDGRVRDVAVLRRIGLPIFATGVAIRGTIKQRVGAVGGALRLGDVEVGAGDAVIGDDDGVVIVPATETAAAADAAEARERNEATLRDQIRAGRSTLDLLGLRRLLDGTDRS